MTALRVTLRAGVDDQRGRDREDSEATVASDLMIEPDEKRTPGAGLDTGTPSWAAPRPHEWLLLSIGVVLVLSYRWLIDDSFIYFRYVDNLLFLDIGLVFNQGEYVEGFSSPMQVMVLTPLRALGFDWFHIITGLGVACFVAFGLLVIKLNRELSPTGPIFDLPLVVLAAGYGTTSYFTSGLETPLVHLVAVAIALRLVVPRGAILTAMAAAAPLVRPELAVAVLLTVLFCWRRERRFPWALFGLAVAANGTWLAFRVYYYADLLPNTFYLKDGTKWWRGWIYLTDILYGVPVIQVAALLALLWITARLTSRLRGDPSERAGDAGRVDGAAVARTAMLAIAISVGAYVVRIGGAELHYWYLAFPITLLACASGGCVEQIIARVVPEGRWAASPWIGVAAVAMAVGVAADKPRQLSVHPFLAGERGRRIDLVADASFHREDATLQPASWRRAVSIEDMKRFEPALSRSGYERVITGIGCRHHWVRFRSRVVHGFGLTDPILARVQAPELIAGHKPALLPLAEDLAKLRRAGGVRPGSARHAVSEGSAPEWIAQNLETIEIIERKMGNRHQWSENLGLALSFPPPIVRPAKVPVPQRAP